MDLNSWYQNVNNLRWIQKALHFSVVATSQMLSHHPHPCKLNLSER